jgi:hypothetical protein
MKSWRKSPPLPNNHWPSSEKQKAATLINNIAYERMLPSHENHKEEDAPPESVWRSWPAASSSSSAQNSLQKNPPIEERHACTRPLAEGSGWLQFPQWLEVPVLNGVLVVKHMVMIVPPDSWWTNSPIANSRGNMVLFKNHETVVSMPQLASGRAVQYPAEPRPISPSEGN